MIKKEDLNMRHLNLQTTILNTNPQENSCYSIEIIIHEKSTYIKSFPKSLTRKENKKMNKVKGITVGTYLTKTIKKF